MTLKKTNKILLYAAFFALIVSSCVPARKYEDIVARRNECENANAELKKENEKFYSDNNELSHRNAELLRNIETLQLDTANLGSTLRRINANYEQLHKTYQILLEQNEQLSKGQAAETRRIMARLQETQQDLLRREDELHQATLAMQEKERSLNELNAKLQASMEEIRLKERRLNELESILNRQDSIVNALRRTVSNALLGFQDNGLSVDIRNGKVYVSLEERLLFATGSTTVDPQGVSALKELAKVLEKNPDINVLIEGHTDDVPFRPGSAIKDNWELSVLRATAIVRIILENKQVDPKRLTAAGRSEFLPLDSAKTPEARKKNRRTEIILTPKLDELFQIIQSN
jgi:chemotaxis protein MotB